MPSAPDNAERREDPSPEHHRCPPEWHPLPKRQSPASIPFRSVPPGPAREGSPREPADRAHVDARNALMPSPRDNAATTRRSIARASARPYPLRRAPRLLPKRQSPASIPFRSALPRPAREGSPREPADRAHVDARNALMPSAPDNAERREDPSPERQSGIHCRRGNHRLPFQSGQYRLGLHAKDHRAKLLTAPTWTRGTRSCLRRQTTPRDAKICRLSTPEWHPLPKRQSSASIPVRSALPRPAREGSPREPADRAHVDARNAFMPSPRDNAATTRRSIARASARPYPLRRAPRLRPRRQSPASIRARSGPSLPACEASPRRAC
jgi:hypothetical protein